MFEFGIVICGDGTEIIDRGMVTEYSGLAPIQMAEYVEIDIQLAIMDRLERKRKAESERKRKLAGNPLCRLACLCGIA